MNVDMSMSHEVEIMMISIAISCHSCRDNKSCASLLSPFLQCAREPKYIYVHVFESTSILTETTIGR